MFSSKRKKLLANGNDQMKMTTSKRKNLLANGKCLISKPKNLLANGKCLVANGRLCWQFVSKRKRMQTNGRNLPPNENGYPVCNLMYNSVHNLTYTEHT